MIGDNLREQIERQTERISTILPAPAEFRGVLRGIVVESGGLLEAIEVRVTALAPFTEMIFGDVGVGVPTETRSIALDKYQTQCRISVWRSPQRDMVPTPEIMASLASLVKAYWKPNFRDQFHLVVQTMAGPEVVEATVDALRSRAPYVAEFFCDLDNFKAVNDQIHHKAGDHVIAQFGALLVDVVEPRGVVVHRSGDEFLVLFPAQSVTEVLQVARRAMRAVEVTDFGTGDIRIGATIGIAFVGAAEAAAGLAEVERMAEAAVHDDLGQKNRGRARLYVSAAPTYASLAHDAIDTAVCITKTGLTLSAPFANPWLNLISDQIFAGADAGTAVQAVVDSVLEWIAPEFRSDILAASYDPARPVVDRPRFSRLDVCFAIGHGIMRGALRADKKCRVTIEWEQEAGFCRVLQDGEPSYRWGASATTPHVIDLGYSITASELSSKNDYRACRAILVRIGHQAPSLPECLFAATVVVDDRPTLGGGLPDFWEGAIARLVSSAAADPNITDVFVVGNHSAAKLTVQFLRQIDTWATRSSALSSKTGIASAEIAAVATRLCGRVRFPSDKVMLASQLAALSCEAFDFVARAVPATGTPLRFMNRELQGNGFGLGHEDGCRISTLARAYPLVLEIVRKSAREETILDQAGLELRELLDFKVVLTDPERDLIPSFYANDEESLEEYFREQFSDPNGLFRAALEDGRQLELVLKHVCDTLADSGRRFNTRRAVLVISHSPRSGVDLSPLGLISIRIVPRFVGPRIVLTYSFTWRTVEALVGFPYSLYGSVRFAQELTESIRVAVPASIGRYIDLGELSYVAHSLHFFLDEYGQGIARQIVDEASF